ncbi:Variant surface glycoprotein [Trypanosoma congolense IL3000]|uniref:Variant surface glycoprotein n=1 Tax=Trypanosoma congolense (strain IL3000) TaxID=1068625 RepID=F9WH01_TRYCI|nr:Variant surface glycoprotein [Trypanosoma congolense IL3000]
MSFFKNVVAFLVMAVGSFVSGQVEVAKDDNIEPFALLCRIYNVAKNPPINYVDLEEPFEIVREIDALNRSLLEEGRLTEEEDAGNHSEAQVKPTVTREAAVAQISLNQITQRAHKILEEIKKVNVTEEVGKVKAEFNKVIFGDGGNEDNLCQATVNDMDNRSKACGPPGLTSNGESAGKNLVVDFFCLCAQRTDEEGANQVCGFYVGRISHYYGWDDKNGPWGSSTMWASVKGGCGKHMHQHPKSTSEVRHILDQFLKHLKTGGVYRWGNGKVEGSNRKEGMLGTGVGKNENDSNGPTCNGKKGKNGQTPGGICVYYGPSDWDSNIHWLKKFRTALNRVENINNQTATIQRSIEKLNMLLHRSEEIYETGKVMLEIQNPVGLTAALQNSSGNLTAFNSTRFRSYGYRPHTYFIALLVLHLL